MTTMALPDAAPCHMTDTRLHWDSFKKSVKENAMMWGFRDWLHTVVYGGPLWQQIAKLGVVAKAEKDEEPVLEEKAQREATALNPDILRIMGYSASDLEFFQPSIRFINVMTGIIEPVARSRMRHKLWTWMVRSLHGPKSSPGPYHYLVDEVDPLDVTALYQQLTRVIDTPTIVSQADDVAAVFLYTFNPQTQDIFAYLGEVRKLIKRVHELNDLLPERCRIVIPDTILRAQLLRAMKQVPLYKTLLDSLVIKKPAEWQEISTENLYKHLEQISSNTRDMDRQMRSSTPREQNVQANVAKVQAKQNQQSKNVCFDFQYKGVCSRVDCKFLHEPKNKPSVDASTQEAKQKDENRPEVQCQKCGNSSHSTKQCKNIVGKCSYCNINGHTEQVCKQKKSGKPRANLANVDGTVGQALLLIVSDSPTEQAGVVALSANVVDSVSEIFFADTGANRSIHPNFHAGATFSRIELDIGTASGNKAMKSDGVGSMILYTPDGKVMPGFEKVVFSKQVSTKLASVGDICDTGMVCVFDKNGLRTYKTNDVKIEGVPFTTDVRDKKTRLYPLTLSREKKVNDSSLGALAPLCSTVDVCEEMMWGKLPELIPDKPGQALLAKTYAKIGLSELDRYHAKLGDVGIKAMKRALPSLKIPHKYRCICCIEGKIHKFEGKKCKVGERTKYLPGVCIHSDHSGPYAQSLGGHRYSQLFLDSGSGYLWAVRMHKKVGHYLATPKIIADAQAASGRRLQYFQTDGEGVFAGEQTAGLLEGEKIRHLWGAPHDSNTNPFIERARRTVLEGTTTSLIRSGAPANFWGEAENHKIFTMNVLPHHEDPDEKGVYLSRKNLLEGNKRKFNLDHLMAFGTAVTCYIPIEMRKGGKTPAQRKFFRGVIIGYADNSPAYRLWDIADKKIRVVSYNFTVAHEGFYPFKDKENWPTDEIFPATFFPVDDDLDAFDFDDEDALEVVSRRGARLVPEMLPVVLSEEVVVPAGVVPEGGGNFSRHAGP